jgi:cyanophycinase
MLHRARRLLAASLALLAAPALGAGERLVLVGGGDKPEPAVARFVAWAGGRDARVLVVLWATSDPEGSFDWLRRELMAFKPGSLEAAPLAPVEAKARQLFLDQLERASGVFFSGGDQGRVMDVLLKDRPLLEALRARHRAGVVFGGTSAGAAIMSRIMITGNGDFTTIDATKVETREGLGLLPGAIVDQHFLKRQRENRLFALILAHPEELGVGIDQDAALLVEDGRRAEVVGGPVMIVDGRERQGSLMITLLPAGARYDLLERKAP